MSSKGVTDEAKCKNYAAVIKSTGGSTSGLLPHLKSKYSIEKPSLTQSDVSSNAQSVIYTIVIGIQSISRVLILRLQCTVS